MSSLRDIKKSTTGKKYKSLTTKSLSNKNSLKNFISKNFLNDKDDKKINIKIIPNNTNLYQGTIYQLDEKKIDEYYDFYNKRHNGAYFLSSYKKAALYGINQSKQNLIYITIPDKDDIINNYKTKYKYIYPLYYLDDTIGININYKSNSNIYLLNISNNNNIKILFDIVYSLSIDDEKKEEYIDILINTVAKVDEDWVFGDYPISYNRISYDYNDEKLVLLFQNIIIPEIKSKWDINIDGWIYYSKDTQNFHDEIMIISNMKITYKTYYKEILGFKNTNIPSRKEYIKNMEKIKIKYDKKFPYNTILNNIANPKSYYI